MKTERRRQPLLPWIGASLAAALLVSCGGTPKPAFEATSTATATANTGGQVMLPLPPPRPDVPTGPGEKQTFPSSDLINLTLPELRRKLGGGLLIGDPEPGLVVSQGAGLPTLSFFTLDQALGDPWAQERWRMGYRAAPPAGEWTSCTTSFGPSLGLSTGSAGQALLVFRGELLIEIRHPLIYQMPPVERAAPRPGETQAQAQKRVDEERRKIPVTHPFLSRAGVLPLADGSAFLSRWKGERMSPNEQLSVRCQLDRPKAAAPRPAVRSEGNIPQAIAMAPLAVMLPGINADRAAAMREGASTWAQLKLNNPVPGGAAAFVKTNRRAFWYAGQNGYGILAIDLGMVETNNLNARGEMAFAGVVNDHVVWTSREAGLGFGFVASHLCLDAENVSANTREGCTGYGIFNPVRRF